MIRLCLTVFAAFFVSVAFGQKQFPSLRLNIDSIFDICLDAKTKDDRKLRLLSTVDAELESIEKDFPLFRGMVYLYEAYHAPEGEARTRYHNTGTSLISSNRKFLADSFSYQCYQLLDYYASAGRLQEWLPLDNILRASLSTQQNDDEWCIFSYANKKMQEGSYSVAQNLSSYDMLIAPKKFPSSTDQRLVRVYDEWITLNSRYKEWLAVSYYNRNEKFTLKKDFKTLILHIHGLRDSVVKYNNYANKNAKVYLRRLYYRVYKDAVMAYADWSINDHREGQAITSLKDFLFSDAIPNEVDPALKAGATPVISCSEISDVYSKLAELYINTGNGTLASEVTDNGIKFLDKHKYCSDDETSRGISYLYYLRTKANRVEGKFEASLKRAQLLKKWWPLPKDNSAASINQWNWFTEARLQEIYTLIAQNNNDAAGDSLNFLLEALAPIENDTVQLLSKSYQWPQVQFASMQYMARLGKWQVVKDYLLEALTIIEQDNHWENVPYYYDMQLLYLIAAYRSDGKVLKHVVANLLFYTGRQLQHSFFMLTPEDRIRFYEQRLSVYFDVYHELLFRKMLDSDSSLKEKVIAQSMHLKNALADANLLPNEFLVNNKDTAWLKLTEDIRASRSRSNILSSRIKMRSRDEQDISDGAQSLWLQLLENADLDSLARFTGWKKIASATRPGQVYVEGIRYTNRLSDSASMYGAYVVHDGKLDIVPMFKESKMTALLRDPEASPQSGSLNSTNGRGFSLTKKETPKKFRPGSEDKLGTLILSPLWTYLGSKKELLIVPDGLLNRVSLAALQWKGQPLFSLLKISQLSGSYVLQQPKAAFPSQGKALLAGGLDYGELKEGVTINRLLNRSYSWQYLPATKKEAEDLQPIFQQNGQQATLLTGNGFPDSLLSILPAYNFIHLATHGFYVDSSTAQQFYDRTWDRETIKNDAMMRCGIALSGANFPLRESRESEGHLLGFELANTDLRNCYLITLSACETGLGDLRNNLGVDGLSRALKLGGAKYLLISLWKVPDAPTAVFMQQFYKELFRVKDPVEALQSTQAFMNKQYNVADWAAFVLVQ